MSTEDMETPGFVFNPSDEQLLGYYLHNKNCVIREIDNICDHEPWDLRRLAVMPSKDTWHFLTHPDRRYKKSGHNNRLTRDGYWKVTGKKREIKNKTTNQVIGFKRILVFYKGRVRKPEKTNWTMHEYYPNSSNSDQTDCIVARLHQRPLKKTFKSAVDEGETGRDSASEVENPETEIMLPEVSSTGRDSASEVENPETEIILPEIESQYWEDFLNFDEQDFPSPTAPQPTSDLADDCNVPFSPFGISDQQDSNTDSGMDPAIQESLPAVTDDSSLSESLGGQKSGNISDNETADVFSDFNFETALGDDNGWVWDQLMEDASACFSWT